MGQDTHPERQWSSGAPQMGQTKLQGWDSHMYHRAAKSTHRDTSCPHRHLLWQKEPAHPRCQRSYPKKCPSRAAASLGCKQYSTREPVLCISITQMPSISPTVRHRDKKWMCFSHTPARSQADQLHQKEVESTSWAQHSPLLPTLCSSTSCSSVHS